MGACDSSVDLLFQESIMVYAFECRYNQHEPLEFFSSNIPHSRLFLRNSHRPTLLRLFCMPKHPSIESRNIAIPMSLN